MIQDEHFFGLTEHQIRNIMQDATYRFEMNKYVTLIGKYDHQYDGWKKRFEENNFVKNCLRKQLLFVLRNGYFNFEVWKSFFEKKIHIDRYLNLQERIKFYETTTDYMKSVIRDSFNYVYPEIYARFGGGKN